LAETIQSLVQMQDLVFFSISGKPRRLSHINFLSEFSIQNCRFHVEMMQFPPELCGDGD
jgi:hypothetical protein